MAPLNPAPLSPLGSAKDYAAGSVFRPENLLRDARRQKDLPAVPVPAVCLLDPDGDLEAFLHRAGRLQPAPGWACYHTVLGVFELGGIPVGLVGRAVGAPFAVLLAEQMFASGCALLLSLTSAGWIGAGPPPSFVLIERALRDEGTSHHYLPPSRFAKAPAAARRLAARAGLPGAAGWTTDAPFRETQAAIAAATAEGAVLVEMEAAGLYAFAAARGRDVLCLAQLTNTLAQAEGDFEKGEANGAVAALALLERLVRAWRSPTSAPG